jgi:cbb3-type cytochrome oxidase subunit 3
MTNSEVFAIAIAGFVVLIIFFICSNNIKYYRKEKKKKAEEAKKNTQPVADISPKQVDIEKDLTAGEPLNVDDPIFTKKGYENITERLSLQAMIDEEITIDHRILCLYAKELVVFCAKNVRQNHSGEKSVVFVDIIDMFLKIH